MSNISLSPNASGTGTLTIAAPNTNSNRTLTLPDTTGTIVSTDASGNITLTNSLIENVYTITDGAAFEINPANGTVQLVTLGASRTPKGTNFSAGQSVTLMVDDGTAYTLTWTDTTFGTSGVTWKTDAGVAPTLNTSGYTVIVLWKVGSQVYGARVGNA